ncbi:MAG: lipopolysaccharide biosynthesis protein [Thiohalomonadales bacterium]
MKTSNKLKKLLIHVSNYSIGSLLVTLAGFISFPILTRLLSQADYGLLSLIGVTLTLLVAIGKLGLQNPIIRFYSDAESNRDGWNLEKYYTTIILGMLVIGLVIMFLWLVIVYFIPANFWNDEKLRSLFMVTALLVLIRVMDSAFSNIFRARQKSRLLSTYRVIRRYASLVLVVVTLFYISNTLAGLYIATIIVELVSVIILGYLLLKNRTLKLKLFSPELLKAMLIFGIPLVGHELAWVLHNTGDRYLIQWMMGAESLGAYAAAYNLSDYVRIIVIMSLYQALPPIYLKIWSEEGEEPTRQFIEKSLHFYIMVALPVLAGISVVGPTLLTILATEKFSAGAVIIPYVIAGMVINGSAVMFGAGLYIHKQTKILMLLMLISAIFNIILNIILIPRFGLEGAAIATLISYTGFAISNKIVSSRKFHISIPWLTVFKFSLVSVLMYFMLIQINVVNSIVTLFVQICAGIVFYVVLAVMLDKTAKKIAQDIVLKFSRSKSI